MAKFLVGSKLSKKIKKVCSGKNLCCAVAFWGNGALKHLFSKKNSQNLKARIICDLSMGGTNPKELEQMGAPESKNIKQIKGLHAKVYISDVGVIITSANASENGIGFITPKIKNIEAGSFSKKDTQHWHDAKKWFEQTWKEANKVSAADLENAQILWNKRVQFNNTTKSNIAKGNLSIIEAIKQCPEVFGNIQFVLSNQENDKSTVELAEKSYSNEHGRHPEGYDYFEGWGLSEEDWPEVFISIHMGPRGGLYVGYFKSGPVYNDVHFARRVDIRKSKLIKSEFFDTSLKYNLRRSGELKKPVFKRMLKDLDQEKPMIVSANELAGLFKKHYTKFS